MKRFLFAFLTLALFLLVCMGASPPDAKTSDEDGPKITETIKTAITSEASPERVLDRYLSDALPGESAARSEIGAQRTIAEVNTFSLYRNAVTHDSGGAGKITKNGLNFNAVYHMQGDGGDNLTSAYRLL